MNLSTRHVVRFGHLSIQYHSRTILVCCLILTALVVLSGIHMATGSISFSFDDVVQSLTGDGQNPIADRVILRLRLPRLLTAIFVGAALGVAGAVFQSISRNALGSPDIIGFTTGAATGAIVQIIVFNASPLVTAASAVAAGIATAVIVFFLALKGRTSGGYRLILIGLGMGAMLSGVNTVLLVAGDLDQAASAQLWLSGSLNTRTWQHAILAISSFIVLVPCIICFAKPLMLLEMGDDSAKQLGVATERTRLTTIAAAVGLTSIATAAAGPIAFIALASPQIARRITSSPQVPLLTAAFTGASLLAAADILSQRLPFNVKLPIGLTTGLLGGLYLLVIIVRTNQRKQF